jgi:geranylgeranyl pyrophosphate synthase
MAASLDPIPLSDHRASLQRYLREIVPRGDSVAGRIIEERLLEPYARDPVRATLVLWACAAANGDVTQALPVAAAFDLFDRFLLLHNELAEASPTVARWGLGQSLKGGDALYALAFRTLATDVTDAPRRLAVARLVAGAILEALGRANGETALSAVLTGAALQAGAIIAGAPQHVTRKFLEAGRVLGSDPAAAVAALRHCTSRKYLDAFEEVARYVARRAA